jgi:hypothetical protein
MFMQFFEEAYKDAITKYEKGILYPNSLDPNVFYFPETGDPILLPSIEQQILRNIQQINQTESQFMQTRVWDFLLTGPILKKDASETCPIIIKLQLNVANLDDVLKEKILERIKDINDKLAVGTRHPIVYIPSVRKIEFDENLGAYHVFLRKWVRKPNFLESI